jgi:hypothetical protein
MFIIEGATVTVNCRTSIKDMFLYLDLCISVMSNSLSCSFTSISFLNSCNIYLRIPSARFQYQTMFVSFNSSTNGDTSGTGTANASGTP